MQQLMGLEHRPNNRSGIRLIFWSLMVIVLVGCAQEPPAIRLAAISGSDQDPTILFEGFKMVSSKEQKPLWVFHAQSAQIYEKINLAKAQHIKITYLKEGREQSSLTAKRGQLNTKTNQMVAEENVIMISKDGVVLKTEKLNWDQEREKIYTDQPVRVEKADSILTGIGLETDSDLKHIQILDKVKIKVKSMKELKFNEK